jgi:hypothetical protein
MKHQATDARLLVSLDSMGMEEAARRQGNGESTMTPDHVSQLK